MAKSKKQETKKEVTKKASTTEVPEKNSIQEKKEAEKVKEVINDNLKTEAEEQSPPTKKELSHAQKVANVVQNRTV